MKDYGKTGYQCTKEVSTWMITTAVCSLGGSAYEPKNGSKLDFQPAVSLFQLTIRVGQVKLDFIFRNVCKKLR